MKAIVAGIEWDLTGKTQVQCDECRDVYATQMWKFPNRSERARLAEDLREQGWLVKDDHERHICPRCLSFVKSL